MGAICRREGNPGWLSGVDCRLAWIWRWVGAWVDAIGLHILLAPKSAVPTKEFCEDGQMAGSQFVRMKIV
jgi:hypothetical protein